MLIMIFRVLPVLPHLTTCANVFDAINDDNNCKDEDEDDADDDDSQGVPFIIYQHDDHHDL